MKNKKKIWTVIAISGAAAFLILLTFSYRNLNMSIQVSDFETSSSDEFKYYNDLSSQCEGDECCLASVNSMFKGGYKLATDGQCPEGYDISMLRCITSYKWCEPQLVQ
jgi:hypothetical protein